MKITLNIDPNTGDGTCLVEREPGDRRYRRGGFGGTAESHFLHHVKQALVKQGYDVIKKRMHRDGHMVDEFQQYLRERTVRKGKRCLTLRNGSWALYDAGERFNEDGRVELLVENIGSSMEPAVVVAKKVVPVDPPKAPVSTEPVVTMKSVSIAMGQVPSPDPLAYAYGFTHGVTGRAEDTTSDLKDAYNEGYAQGRRVRFGEEPIPAWARAA